MALVLPPPTWYRLGSELIAADPRFAKAVFIFPGAPLELDPMFDARAWWMIDMEKIQQLMERGETREMRSTSPDQLPLCREAITQVIEFAREEYSLKANQIVVGGFSQGSMLATDVALHYGEPLGGLIIWSGALINEPVWQECAKQQEQLRIVQTHGRIDPILPIEAPKASGICWRRRTPGCLSRIRRAAYDSDGRAATRGSTHRGCRRRRITESSH